MKKDEILNLTAADAEVLEALTEFRDALKEGVRIDKKFTVRSVHVELKTHNYQPEDIKRIRWLFNLSQAMFGLILGVSVKTVSSWEQGRKKPSPIANRFIDEMASHPDYWRQRIRDIYVTTGGDAARKP